MKNGNNATAPVKKMLLVITSVAMIISIFITLHGCKKTSDTSGKNNPVTENMVSVRKRNNPPPTPPPFYFTNCSNPSITGNFVAGTPTTATITLVYANSPGSVSYPAFTSNTVNGIQ